MTEMPKLLVDADRQRERLSELLERLVTPFERPPLRDAVGDAGLGRIRRERDAVMQRLGEPFTLVVLGDFKRGKSTLVNALVGADLAPTDVTPETVTVNCFVHGPVERVRAVLPDGTRAVLNHEDLRHDRLVDLLGRLPARPTHVIVERPVRFLEGLRLVDTPGLGDLDPELSRAVLDWLPAADAVLFVITAVSPLSDSERLFLRLSVEPAQLSKVCFVLNRIDLVAPGDVDRLVESVGSKVRGAFPDSPVFPVSAVHPDDNRFAALRRHLDEAVLVDRDLVKLDRAAFGTREAVLRARDRLGRLDAALASDQARLADTLAQVSDHGSALRERVAEARSELITGIRALGDQAAKWMAEFVDRLANEVGTDLSRHPHDVLRRHFPFFLAERTREALTACIDAHRGAIDSRLLAASPSEVAGLDFGAADHPSVAGLATPGSAWTLADDLGMLTTAAQLVAPYVGPLIAAVLIPLGLLESVAGLAVRGVLQKTAGEQAKGRAFHEHVIHALPELKNALDGQVQGLYRDLADKVANRFDELWTVELTSAREVLEQAQGVRSRGDDEATAVRAAIGQALTGFEALTADVDAFRADSERLL